MSIDTEYQGQYAANYDAIYQDRDIAGDCNRLATLLNVPQHSKNPYRLLDFGCGTGSHALHLAKMGLEVVGLDISQEMVQVANNKLPSGSSQACFVCGEACLLKNQYGEGYFDGVISLFNVLNCMMNTADILSTLCDIRAVLSTKGKMVVELWNGAAVLSDQPRVKTKRLTHPDSPGEEISVTLTPSLDKTNQRIELNYGISIDDRTTGQNQEWEQKQTIFFLTPEHYLKLFGQAGYQVLEQFPTRDPQAPLTNDHWFVSYLLENAG